MHKSMAICLLIVCISPLFAAPAPKPKPPPEPEDVLELQDELSRFPSKDECRRWIDLADEHRKCIRERIGLHPEENWDLMEYERQITEWRGLWIALWEARTGLDWSGYDWNISVKWRWDRLRRIREAVGDNAYYQGFLYPPIAAHMFPRRD